MRRFQRLRRLWPALAVFGLVVGLVPAVTSSIAPASAATCIYPSVMFLGVRGSGETASDGNGTGLGNTVYDTWLKFSQQVPSAGMRAIDYPAIGVNFWDPSAYAVNYVNSVAAGKSALVSYLTLINTSCPSTTFVLAGYSQGAQVVADVLQQMGGTAAAKIVGVALFGDPRFRGSQSATDRGTYSPKLNGVWQSVGTLRTFTKAETAVARSYCTKHDPVCNYTYFNAQNCVPPLIGPSTCVHLEYAKLGYTAAAASWLVSKVPPPPPPPLTLSSLVLQNGTVGQAYSQPPPAVAGGKPPYKWGASGTALQNGLSVSASTGMISGSALAAGTFSLTLTVTDSLKATASSSASWMVGSTTGAERLGFLSSNQAGTAAYLQSVNSTGGDLRTAATLPASFIFSGFRSAAWSPVSTNVVITSMCPSPSIYTCLYITDTTVPGSTHVLVQLDPSTVTTPFVDGPVWSPDGKQIAFAAYDYYAYEVDYGLEQIWVVNSDGSNPHAIMTSDPGNLVQPNGCCHWGISGALHWSPDSSHISYETGDYSIGVADANQEMHIISAAGGSPVGLNVTETAASGVWDGNNAMYFLTPDPTGHITVRHANLDGTSDQLVMTLGVTFAYHPEMSANGLLAYDDTSSGASVWTVADTKTGLSWVLPASDQISNPTWIS